MCSEEMVWNGMQKQVLWTYRQGKYQVERVKNGNEYDGCVCVSVYVRRHSVLSQVDGGRWEG